jgi:hypothetical protein
MAQHLRTSSLLTSLALILSLILLSTNVFAAIGKVTEEKGKAEIVRKKDSLSAKINSGVESMDTVQTGNGVVGITFSDDTKVRVTEHSRLVIDDFVYDPKAKNSGKLAMKVAMGTVRYASGAVAKDNSKNVDIKTPTATIAVRGTAFTMTVDEIGKSMIVLLPNVDGSVGEIDVITAVGSVTLNLAFQSTVVTSSEVKPMPPVILNLNESAINNMMLVSPPKEIIKKLKEEALEKTDALSFVELDRNALDVIVWKEELSFDELNIDGLKTNYLTNELDSLIMTSLTKGFNSTTQVYTIDRGEAWQLDRHIKNQSATILINKDRGYDITLIQDGILITILTQEGARNKTKIDQRSR